MSFFKLTLSSVAVGVGADETIIPLINNSAPFTIYGVELGVIGAAFFGAGLSLFFGEPVRDRRELLGQVIASSFFGVALAILVANAFSLDWAIDNLGLFVVVFAAVTRWFLPEVINRFKVLIREIKLPSKEE